MSPRTEFIVLIMSHANTEQAVSLSGNIFNRVISVNHLEGTTFVKLLSANLFQKLLVVIEFTFLLFDLVTNLEREDFRIYLEHECLCGLCVGGVKREIRFSV